MILVICYSPVLSHGLLCFTWHCNFRKLREILLDFLPARKDNNNSFKSKIQNKTYISLRHFLDINISSGEFKYSHFGYITYGVDERAEVGLLSRNIRIEGEVQKTCYYNDEREKYLCERFGIDTFGGHVKVKYQKCIQIVSISKVW